MATCRHCGGTAPTGERRAPLANHGLRGLRQQAQAQGETAPAAPLLTRPRRATQTPGGEAPTEEPLMLSHRRRAPLPPPHSRAKRKHLRARLARARGPARQRRPLAPPPPL